MFHSSDCYRIIVAAVLAAVPGLFLARDGVDGALISGIAAGIVFGVVYCALKLRSSRTA